MFRARRKARAAKGLHAAEADTFQAVAGHVDRAKDALLAAVPARRGPGVPLAEALASFEEHLRAARKALEAWPEAQDHERTILEGAIDGSSRGAAALRLDASPEGYEELYTLLGEILDPLDALEDVAGRLGLR